LLARRRGKLHRLALERRERRLRQKIVLDDEPVAPEGRAVFAGDQRPQSFAAPLGHPAGKPDAGDMQPGAIEGRTADNRIVAKRLRAGRQRCQVKR
jgi:hypothetical protein